MENIKCETCDKKNECTELCPAAQISELSGTIVPTGAELAKKLQEAK